MKERLEKLASVQAEVAVGTLVSALVIARAFSGTSRAASLLVAHHQR